MFDEFMDSEASSFANVYDHLSTNDKQFELICFLRWFAIKNFVNKHSIKRFFLLRFRCVIIL